MIKMINNRGFTLLEAMVGVAIVSIASLGIVGLSVMANKTSSDVSQRVGMLTLKSSVMAHIENPDSWETTVKKNTSDSLMQCLTDGSDCKSGGSAPEAPIDLYTSDGTLFYPGTKSTAGFTADGKVCDGFSSTSESCPYRYDLKWKAICPTSGPCTNPLVSVNGTLLTSNKVNENTGADSDFVMLRSFAKNTVQRNCKALGGVVEGGTCVTKKKQFRCPSGKAVVGLNADSSLICGSPAVGSCSAGQFLVSFDLATGSPVCKNIDKQFSILDPEKSGKISCMFLKKTEGEIWFAKFGETLKPEACPEKEQGSRSRAYALDAEMTCSKGIAVPTGRVVENKTDKLVGHCEATVPYGVSSGDYFWISAGTNKEAFACYGSPDIAYRRYITYNVEQEMLYTEGRTVATGRTRKSEASREPCPSISAPQSYYSDVKAAVKPATTKIMFVIDNSNSMSVFQQNLAAKIAPLVKVLQGSDIKVKIINSTAPDNNNKSTPLDSIITYADESGNSYDNKQVPSAPTTVIKTHIHKLKNLPTYSIEPSSTQDQVNAFQAAIMAGITGQGIKGTSTEVAMCNLLISLYEDGPTKFFEKGDLGGIIVLTDDDDYSTWKSTTASSCRNYLKQKQTVSPAANYNMVAYRWKLTYKGFSNNDGIKVPGNQIVSLYVPPEVSGISAGDACTADAETALTTAAIKAGNANSPFEKVSCLVELVNATTLVFDHTTVNDDYCSKSFIYKDVNYSNISDFYAKVYKYNMKSGSCTRAIKATETPISTEFGISQYVGTKSIYSDSLPQAIYDKGRDLFGDKGFFLLNIVMTDPSSCTPVSSQPKSLSYLSLADLMSKGGNSYQNFSICGSNDGYGETLTNLAKSIKTVIDSSVIVDIPDGSEIEAVKVRHADGSATTLKANKDYVMTGNRIDLTGYVPLTGDRVEVSVLMTYSGSE